MADDYPMGFDWIFFVIVFTPVLIAAWELYRIRKEPKPELTDPWVAIFRQKQPRHIETERPVRVLEGR